MLRNLLVPLDGSELAEQALPLAVSIAKQVGATLYLARVVPLSVQFSVETWPAVEEARGYLENTVARVRTVADVPVEMSVLTGNIGERLEENARDVKADLVVLTTHGRGPLSRFWFGSIADELIRRLPVALLAVHPRQAPPDLRALPALSRILIPLDGSPLAERILSPAQALGRPWKVDYTLFQSVYPMTVPAYEAAFYASGSVDDAVLAQARRNAHDYLETIALMFRSEALPVRTVVAAHLHPALAILEAAELERADVIAIATHGRGGLGRLLLGSVADKVLRGATIPVLIQRPPAE
jgi:nucleotide-binding universal stress UspA family protein